MATAVRHLTTSVSAVWAGLARTVGPVVAVTTMPRVTVDQDTATSVRTGLRESFVRTARLAVMAMPRQLEVANSATVMVMVTKIKHATQKLEYAFVRTTPKEKGKNLKI